MFKLAGFLFLALSISVYSQDAGVPDVFTQALQSIIGQWGQLDPSQIAELLSNFQHGGLHHIWNNLTDHCSSNYQCGPDACCLSPIIQGKRAISSGGTVHYGSYCAKLRNLGDSCSVHNNTQHYYTSHCPCDHGLRCLPSSYVQIHPGLSIPVNAVCRG